MSSSEYSILQQIKNKWDVRLAKIFEQPPPTHENGWYLKKELFPLIDTT